MQLIQEINNLRRLDFGNLKVWFSYETPIAIKIGFDDVLISENIWTRATGKHINHIKQNYKYIEKIGFIKYRII